MRGTKTEADDTEAGMVLALRSGAAVLGWAKAPQDPWWPCIAARSLAPLGLFDDDIDPSDLELSLDPSGAAPNGKWLAWFLGEETCGLVDASFFDLGVYARRPHSKNMQERPEYAKGVRLAERLQARVDALEEGQEMAALRAAVAAGRAAVIEARAEEEKNEGGDAVGAGPVQGVPLQLLHRSWPAVAFEDWEVGCVTVVDSPIDDARMHGH